MLYRSCLLCVVALFASAANAAENKGLSPAQEYVGEYIAVGAYMAEDPAGDFEAEGLFMRSYQFSMEPGRGHGFMLGLNYDIPFFALSDDRPYVGVLDLGMGYHIQPVDGLVIYGNGGVVYAMYDDPNTTDSYVDEFSLGAELGVMMAVSGSLAFEAAFRTDPNELIDQPSLRLGARFGPVYTGLKQYLDSETSQIYLGFSW